jgi:glycosyltransferase involved in cell wall biosynthesis
MEEIIKKESSRPLFTIITVCYNAVECIEKTINSVISQNFNNYEYIVVDGVSTDGTIEIIRKFEDKINNWISEPDSGIYNAMNKAILLSKGDYCLFLNAGDYLLNENVLSWVAPYIKDKAVYTGGCVTTQKDKIDDWYYAPQNPSLWNFYTGSICHQSSFIPRDLLLENPYDENLKLVSDWKFWLEQLVINNFCYYSIPVTVCVFNMDGSTYKYVELGRLERGKVLSELFPERILSDYYNRLNNEGVFQIFMRRTKNFIRRQRRILLFKIKEKSDKQY